jgi:hypothetical protein
MSVFGEQKNPHVTLKHERDSPKVIVFCAISKKKVYGPFIFVENTVTRHAYLMASAPIGRGF